AALLRLARQSLHLRGGADPLRALWRVRSGRGAGGRRHDSAVLSAGGDRLRPAARHAPPHRAGAAGVMDCHGRTLRSSLLMRTSSPRRGEGWGEGVPTERPAPRPPPPPPPGAGGRTILKYASARP